MFAPRLASFSVLLLLLPSVVGLTDDANKQQLSWEVRNEPISLSASPNPDPKDVRLLVPDRTSFSFVVVQPKDDKCRAEYGSNKNWVTFLVGECSCSFQWGDNNLHYKEYSGEDRELTFKKLPTKHEGEQMDVHVFMGNGKIALFTEMQTRWIDSPSCVLDFGRKTFGSMYVVNFSMRGENLDCNFSVRLGRQYMRYSDSMVATTATTKAAAESTTQSETETSSSTQASRETTWEVEPSEEPVASGCAWMWVAVSFFVVFALLVGVALLFYFFVIRPKRLQPAKFNYIDSKDVEAKPLQKLGLSKDGMSVEIGGSKDGRNTKGPNRRRSRTKALFDARRMSMGKNETKESTIKPSMEEEPSQKKVKPSQKKIKPIPSGERDVVVSMKSNKAQGKKSAPKVPKQKEKELPIAEQQDGVPAPVPKIFEPKGYETPLVNQQNVAPAPVPKVFEPKGNGHSPPPAP